ncbi:Na+/H+ antiporter NhaA [Agromyces sp. SYSU T00194]|uniref:Na+/H+ antiporter NhaA n=1 Tax=Agromyces chitinivorans TaxID=3158560 RepID=UPI003399CF21
MAERIELTTAPAGPPGRARPTRSRRPRFSGGSTERTAAGLLLLATLAAILWANSPWNATYDEFWSTEIELAVGGFDFHISLRHLVNDGIMTLFFFAIGLEVKREITIGELTDRSRAMVPMIAAVAGLVVPALVFLALAGRTDEASAWGVVISTDTAFLVGALAVIGPRFPARLRIFLLTLAVVDDVGALGAIAIFYSSDIQLFPLLLCVVFLAGIFLVRYLPVGRGPAYVVLSIAAWAAMYSSGVHPTLAGVAIALLIPVFPPRRRDVERAMELTTAFRQSPSSEYAAAATRGLRESISVNERLQTAYSPYVTYLVLPLFALANAGVRLDAETVGAALGSMLFWGIVAGLVIGKFVGITATTAIVRATGIGTLAPGLTLVRVAGGAALSGIGFTISLFIVDIAIEDPLAQSEARFGVLVASVVAFLLAWAIFRLGDRFQPPVPVGGTLARPVDPERDHIRGPVDAPLTLVEYGDFECPFCSRATGSIDHVRSVLGDELRYVWRHLPLTEVHEHAVDAARAAEAAAKQGAFFDMGQLLFANQDRLDVDDLCTYANQLGLDADRFLEDFNSTEVANRVTDDALDAEVMDLHSTPTFFIGDKRHKGPYDAATLVDALRASRDPAH